jgi:hypothetical protein
MRAPASPATALTAAASPMRSGDRPDRCASAALARLPTQMPTQSITL